MFRFDGKYLAGHPKDKQHFVVTKHPFNCGRDVFMNRLYFSLLKTDHF